MSCASKTLYLTVMSFAAINILAASVTLAAAGDLHIDTAERAVLTGQVIPEQQAVFKMAGFPIRCKSANLEGTVEGGSPQITATEVTLTAKYGECELSGVTAVIQMNGCRYQLKGIAERTAQLRIVGCTAGKTITFIVGLLCTITIGEQSALAHVVMENSNTQGQTEEKDVIDKFTVSGIEAGGSCPHGESSIEGSTIIRAFNDLSEQEQLTELSHQFTRHKCGSQVGLFAT